MTASITAVTARDRHRLGFLPRHLGRRSIAFETFAFSLMDRASPDYDGGFWLFRQLSNGGFYIAPDRHEPMRLVWEDNFFDRSMSADAAGIAVTLFALSHLSFRFESETIAKKFHLLREYALDHEEAAAIFGFID